MRPENAFPVEPSKVVPSVMREIERAMPVWSNYVDLRLKKKLKRAAKELPAVEAAVCTLVQHVLQPADRDLNSMYVAGMLLWADGVGPHTQEQKLNHVLYRVPELGRCAASLCVPAQHSPFACDSYCTFVAQGIVGWCRYEGVAGHPTCIANYRRTLANTGRCSIHFYAQAMTIYKHLDLPMEAEALFGRALEVMGPMGWQTWRQTPDLVPAPQRTALC